MQPFHSIPAFVRTLFLTATSLLVAVLLPAVAGATVSLVAGPPYSLGVVSDDQQGVNDNDSVNISTLLPYIDTLSANDGDASASVDITMDQSGFDFDVAFQSAGNPLGGDGSASFSAFIRFSVDTATAYSFSGVLSSLENVGNGSGSIFIWLQDTGTVFMTDQQEIISNGELFAIDADGLPGGDNVNTITGAQSGVLLPGIDYTLNMSLANSMAQTPLSGFGSSGSLSVAFTPVPEPSTATLFGLGLVGLGCLRRRS